MLGLALCLWMIAFAAHIHTDGDKKSNEPSSVCSFCLSLTAGAPSPTPAAAAQRLLIATDAIVDVVPALVALDAPSFYLSRGPPAL